MNSISFIIPAYNCEKTLEESVQSILESNFAEGDEIIIINDASTDNTLKLASKLAVKNSAIKVLSHTINKGSAAASRNTGIDQAKNALIFCLDSDNILAPESIAPLKKFVLDEKADAAAFGMIHYFINTPSNITDTATFKSGATTLDDALAGTQWPGPSGNYLFTKESWKKAGRYNESIGGAYDSWAFGIAQIATGAKLICLPDTFYYHRHGYDSTFVTENKKHSASLTALSVLLPYLNLIKDEDVDYMFSKEHRYTWFENLEKRPLHTKSGKDGINGTKVQKNSSIERVLWKIKKRLS